MHRRALAVAVAVSAVAFTAGCRRTDASGTASQPGHARDAAAAAAVATACDRGLVTRDDVAAILRDPIATMKSLAADGDPQACEFVTAGFASVTISLRPGLGNTTAATWASGRMPMPAETLRGVGDRAVWSAELKEVIATKNDLLCDIGVGSPPGASLSSSVFKQRLGELCNKVFAARP
jgi:hypothetical protein